MDYVSTRGAAPSVGFEQALLKGLAPDGGLYVPKSWPILESAEKDTLKGAPFAEAAARIIAKFSDGALDYETLSPMAETAYQKFSHAQTTPLTQFGDEDWLLELFHGPTLAFKDVAMQFLGQLFSHVLNAQDKHVTIIGATSGDTGAAAIEAFRGQESIDVFILHPEGRVSDVQRRIMTSVDDPNIHNIAINGTFDDCQRLVKQLFSDRALSERLSLSGVNSINWVRLAVQIVYYFTSASALDKVGQKLSFVAPTGNFGDIFAGYAAKRMGAPIEKLCIAVNENDILHRALTTGQYQPRGVKQTTSPSMDIQVASNFERLIYEASGRRSEIVQKFVTDVDTEEGAAIPSDVLENICQDFISETVSEQETKETITDFKDKHDTLIDPHTAVGLAAMRKVRVDGRLAGPAVTLSTAHPAKFPEAVKAASGHMPTLPDSFADLYDRKERCLTAEADLDQIKQILLAHARAAN